MHTRARELLKLDSLSSLNDICEYTELAGVDVGPGTQALKARLSTFKE